MNGVDNADQLMWYYRLNTKQHRHRKWWWPIFLWGINLAITNSYIMHKELCHKAEVQRKKDLKNYMDNLPHLRSGESHPIPEHLATEIKPKEHKIFRENLAKQLAALAPTLATRAMRDRYIKT